MHSPACWGRRPRHLCNTSLVSTGRQCLPKILPQFPMLRSPQKAPRGFICSNLCCSFATDRRGIDYRCNPKWGELLGHPVQPRATSCNDRHHMLLPFLSPNIISDTCFKLPTAPCSTSFGYEKIPTPLWNTMTQVDITDIWKVRIKEGKKIILKYSLGCSSEKHTGQQAVKATHFHGTHRPRGTCRAILGCRSLMDWFCCRAAAQAVTDNRHQHEQNHTTPAAHHQNPTSWRDWGPSRLVLWGT